jgi:hypothetical protein
MSVEVVTSVSQQIAASILGGCAVLEVITFAIAIVSASPLPSQRRHDAVRRAGSLISKAIRLAGCSARRPN